MILLYAIARREHAVPAGQSGLEERPLRAVVDGDLSAVVAECAAPPAPSHAALLRFEQAVEELMGDRTVLPARFGTILPDDIAAAELLRARHDELADALRRVSGAVELGVRAAWPEDDVGPSRPSGPDAGAEYLLGRLELRRRARQIADEIDAAVCDLARERSCRVFTRPESPVSAAYLVPRPRVAEFVARCQGLAETLSGANLVCTGPWPPYNFVTRVQT
jgi:Gas vesicle synthesis protein GvpL/GvpF